MGRIVIFTVFITISLCSCDNSKFNVDIPTKNFDGLWLVSSVTGPKKNDAALPAMIKFNTGRWIQFNDDSTYTTNIKGQFDYGKFSPLGNGKDFVEMRSFRGDIYHISARYHPNGTGEILHRITIPDLSGTFDYYFYCNVRKYSFRHDTFNPYSLPNNQWRLPAEHSENDSLLVKRMVNHIDFWIAYLNMADKLELKSFNYSNVNTCFKFSPYGIIMENFKNWESTFQTLFYTKKEAERAYKLTSEAIYKSKYVKHENAYIQGINLFKQIQFNLLNTNKG